MLLRLLDIDHLASAVLFNDLRKIDILAQNSNLIDVTTDFYWQAGTKFISDRHVTNDFYETTQKTRGWCSHHLEYEKCVL